MTEPGLLPEAGSEHPLGRFVAVGAGVTAIDVGLLCSLHFSGGLPLPAADAAAIVGAAAVSYPLHRAITFGDSPYARWVELPGAYVAVAVVAGAVDLAVLSVLSRRSPQHLAGVLAAKAPALLAAAGLRAVAYRGVLGTNLRREMAVRPLRPPPQGDFRLSVVVPAFGEEDRIADSVVTLRRELAEVESGGGLEIVVVDDGSSDATSERAWAAGADQVCRHPVNRGKGAAVRAGMLAARGATIAFTDADLAYSPRQLLALLHEVESGWDVAVGSRKHTQTKTLVKAGRVRELGGRAINLLTYAVLLGRHRDTQCGVKAFRGEVARRLFSATRVDGFAFDVEIFHLVERFRLSLTEVPVEVSNSSRSTVRVGRHGLSVIRDLVRIRRGAAQGWYRRAPQAA